MILETNRLFTLKQAEVLELRKIKKKAIFLYFFSERLNFSSICSDFDIRLSCNIYKLDDSRLITVTFDVNFSASFCSSNWYRLFK